MEKLEADVAIIGAGITGCSIARELSKYKIKTIVIEKEADAAWGTTKANSGLIHPGYAGTEGTLKLKICNAGSKLFLKNAQELEIAVQNDGSMLNALNEIQIKELELNLRQGQKYGVPGLEIIYNNNGALRKLEPNISNNVKACLYCKVHYRTSPYEAAIAIFENAKLNGVDFVFSSKVISIHYDNVLKKFFIETLSTSGRLDENYGLNSVIEADYIVNAAGIFADEISRMSGDGFYNIKAFKGQYFLLDTETKGFVKRLNLRISDTENSKSKGLVVIPALSGNLLLGSTYEYTDKYDDSTVSGVLEDVKLKLNSLFENIPFEKTITTFTGLRAVSDSHDFVLGPSKVNERFIEAAGIESPGLTCAFIIAEMTADFLNQKGVKLISNPSYKPHRKKSVKLDKEDFLSNNSYVNDNHDYGEIICRCEKVTKAEIIEAIRNGATTIDGIKFRTRAGMGRCQGGYCTLKVMKILSEKLGIPFNEITKSGGNSYIAGKKMA